tara:strand:+ start:14362 stop:15504 length:1143 start_codon:yes stop_codon:yes gene_type:complete
LSDSQESFTSVLDLNSNEIYVDQGLIPSNNLPFNSSGDHLSVYVDPKTGFNVLKYWFRHKLTKSDLNNEVWFFLNPVGVDNGIGAQLIDSNQQVNFISPKYSDSSLSNSTVEDGTAGYGVKLYVSTNSSSPSPSDLVQPSTYAFDFKNGVVQFKSSVPSSNKYVYISAYQYVGRTLSEQLDNSNPDSIQDIFKPTGSFYSTTNDLQITGSLSLGGDFTVHGSFTSSLSETVVINDNIIELNGNESNFGGISIKDTSSPNLVSGSLLWDTVNDEWIAGQLGSELPIARQDDLIWGNSGSYWSATSDLQVTGSVIIKGDLVVEGQTTLQSQDINKDSLIVSGAMSIIKNQINNQIRSASLEIENLGVIGDISNNSIMDLGGF